MLYEKDKETMAKKNTRYLTVGMFTPDNMGNDVVVQAHIMKDKIVNIHESTRKPDMVVIYTNDGKEWRVSNKLDELMRNM